MTPFRPRQPRAASRRRRKYLPASLIAPTLHWLRRV